MSGKPPAGKRAVITGASAGGGGAIAPAGAGQEGGGMRASGRKRRLLIALACGLLLIQGGRGARGEESPLDTHHALSVRAPGRTKWLLTAPAGKEAGAGGRTLLAFTMDGDFHPFAFEKKEGALRARARDHPAPSDLAAEVPPVRLPDGSFVGAGRSGMFINVDAIERRWLFVWPSVPPSTLSRPAVLGEGAAAVTGADGSLLLFRRRGGEWAETRRVGAKAARARPDADLTAADLDGDGRKELLVLSAPGGGRRPTEIHAYRFDGKSLARVAAYEAGGGGFFAPPGALASDLDGDGKEEILLTRSAPGGGAAHLALAFGGGRLALKARGEAAPRARLLGAFRIDGGAPKLLAVEEPPPAGFLLALRLSGGRLRERARAAGFSARAADARNAGRFALLRRRGIVEVALPRSGGRGLGALALFGSRWRLRWSRPLSAPPRSNILAADFNADAKDDLAFVDQAGVARVYLSK